MKVNTSPSTSAKRTSSKKRKKKEKNTSAKRTSSTKQRKKEKKERNKLLSTSNDMLLSQSTKGDKASVKDEIPLLSKPQKSVKEKAADVPSWFDSNSAYLDDEPNNRSAQNRSGGANPLLSAAEQRRPLSTLANELSGSEVESAVMALADGDSEALDLCLSFFEYRGDDFPRAFFDKVLARKSVLGPSESEQKLGLIAYSENFCEAQDLKHLELADLRSSDFDDLSTPQLEALVETGALDKNVVVRLVCQDRCSLSCAEEGHPGIVDEIWTLARGSTSSLPLPSSVTKGAGRARKALRRRLVGKLCIYDAERDVETVLPKKLKPIDLLTEICDGPTYQREYTALLEVFAADPEVINARNSGVLPKPGARPKSAKK